MQLCKRVSNPAQPNIAIYTDARCVSKLGNRRRPQEGASAYKEAMLVQADTVAIYLELSHTEGSSQLVKYFVVMLVLQAVPAC